MLEWLESWYESQCDGHWEHSYGIKMETTDNPGWSIFIDIKEIIEKINIEKIEWNIIGDFEEKWVGFKVEDNQFKGSSSPKNLNLIIYVFKVLIEKKEVNHSEIMSLLR